MLYLSMHEFALFATLATCPMAKCETERMQAGTPFLKLTTQLHSQAGSPRRRILDAVEPIKQFQEVVRFLHGMHHPGYANQIEYALKLGQIQESDVQKLTSYLKGEDVPSGMEETPLKDGILKYEQFEELQKARALARNHYEWDNNLENFKNIAETNPDTHLEGLIEGVDRYYYEFDYYSIEKQLVKEINDNFDPNETFDLTTSMVKYVENTLDPEEFMAWSSYWTKGHLDTLKDFSSANPDAHLEKLITEIEKDGISASEFELVGELSDNFSGATTLLRSEHMETIKSLLGESTTEYEEFVGYWDDFVQDVVSDSSDDLPIWKIILYILLIIAVCCGGVAVSTPGC